MGFAGSEQRRKLQLLDQIPQNQCSYAEFDLGRSRFLPPDCPLDGPTGDNNAGALPAHGAKDRG